VSPGNSAATIAALPSSDAIDDDDLHSQIDPTALMLRRRRASG
jgi:hypothetical protein